MVALPVVTWESIVAKRIVSNELNRERRLQVALLSSQVRSDSVKLAMKDRDITDERKLKAQAYAERDACLKVNGELTAKLKRRTPWATTLKVIVGAGVLYGIGSGINAVLPNTIGFLP